MQNEVIAVRGIEKYSTTRILTFGWPRTAKYLEAKPFSWLCLPEKEGRKGEGGLRTMGYCKHSYKVYGGRWWACDSHGQHLAPTDPPLIEPASGAGQDELPLVTIVTVVYNSEGLLERTIQSVLGQSYANIEFIIIDGGSTDHTLDIVRKYENAIDYWVSEPDAGIYDAMNKGVDLASGQWINFMNAGDLFFAQDTIAQVFERPVTANVVYGATLYRYDPEHIKVRRPEKLLNFARGLPFCHQSCFVQATLHKQNKFSGEFKVHADFDIFAGFFMRGIAFACSDIIISSRDCDGVSATNGLSRLRELCSIARKYNGILSMVRFALDIVLRETLKLVLPLRLTRKIQVSR